MLHILCGAQSRVQTHNFQSTHFNSANKIFTRHRINEKQSFILDRSSNRCRRYTRSKLVASSSLATSTTSQELTPIQNIRESGSKITKTAISKLTVAQLRDECILLSLPSEGTKPLLSQRLYDYYSHQASSSISRTVDPPQSSSSPSSSRSPLTTTLPPPPAAAAAAINTDPKTNSNNNINNNSPTNNNNNRTNSKKSASASHTEPKPDPIDIHVTWLGTSSGSPTNKRNVSCIAVRYGRNKLYLVDSGEGTQNQLRTANINPAIISHIFITHLHGDHFFGLIGTLTAIGRARALMPQSSTTSSSSSSDVVYVHGPPELQRMFVAACKAAQLQLTIPVVVIGWVFDFQKEVRPYSPLGENTILPKGGSLKFALQAPDRKSTFPSENSLQQLQSLYESGSDQIVQKGLTWTTKLPGGVRVVAAQLQHRMPCWGYVFQEPMQFIDADDADDRAFTDSENSDDDDDGTRSSGSSSSIDVDEEIDDTKNTQNINTRGLLLSGSKNENDSKKMVRPGRKLVILGDTCNSEAIAPVAMNCDLISHEATFNKGMEDKAEIATHSTSEQAGAFARRIRARTLVLTHFSARYEKVDKFRKIWTAAKEKGISVHELQSSVSAGLLEEARSMAGSTRVFLANDYFTFKVPAREVISSDVLLKVRANGGDSRNNNNNNNNNNRRAQQQQQQQRGRSFNSNINYSSQR